MYLIRGGKKRLEIGGVAGFDGLPDRFLLRDQSRFIRRGARQCRRC